MSANDGHKCYICKWASHAIGQDQTGALHQCRRHAPSLDIKSDANHYPLRQWPIVSAYDWCGDFEAEAK